MIYTSFETGYHAGGFSFARGISTYDPETIKAYTLGSKNRFLDNRLQVNVEAFLWKYKNQQFSQFGYDLEQSALDRVLTRNIGDSTIKGIDLELEALPADNTLLSANVQYLDTKYDSFVYYTPNQGLPPNTTCAVRTHDPDDARRADQRVRDRLLGQRRASTLRSGRST